MPRPTVPWRAWSRRARARCTWCAICRTGCSPARARARPSSRCRWRSCSDVPATAHAAHAAKTARERRDLETLAAPLDTPLRDRIVALWDEYARGATPEAQAVKALDKLETLLQHSQGMNPPGFDYAFNLDYGRRYTSAHPVCAAIRAALDDDTRARLHGQAVRGPAAGGS